MLQIVLKVTSGPHEGREFAFDRHDNFIVGRAKTSQFRLSTKDQFFSRNHFLIEVNPPLCRLLDLNSTNGTFVNGRKVASIALKDGDIIKGGDTTISVTLVSSIPKSPPHVAVSQEPIPVVRSSAAKPKIPAITPQIHSTPQPSSARPTPTLPRVVNDQTIVPQNWTRNRPNADSNISATGSQTMIPVPGSGPGSGLLQKVVAEVSQAVPEPSADDKAKISAQPQPFDGYDIIEELGRGGMGVVYRARDRKNGELVALKVVLPAVESSPEDLARFVREASIVKELSHPNIVPFRDLGHAAGQLYFVMNLVPGIDGQALLRNHSEPLPLARAINITCQLLEALSAAHSAGYVHRDVKPSNLLIEQRPTGDFVWLADFGLAREYQSSMLSGLTTTGSIGGTLPYMAPEQITNYRDVSPAADQYSAAATLYHLLTRSYPYDFPSDVAQRLLMILQESPQPIQLRRPDIPAKLCAIIHTGLARLPTQRFADVAHFREALQLCIPKA